MKFLAQGPSPSLQNVFGTIQPPGPQALNDPGTGLSKVITTGIQVAIFGAGLLLLAYMLYGAFLYITSEGDEEKATSARNTMTYAVLGIVLLFVGLAIFNVVAGNVLNIISRDAAGNIYFKLPTVGN